ncbi:MAG: TrpB-like pyridoxal phosphate-dependent enzyme [Deltaproteobacteria bacterium]|jgi:tryptophan synthase beta chain|nr:TrpB-like pyridoxal phosphate-dependent enzyme [Deltaproteobacteria bacterium]MBT4267315.1 TrpB-like pyridoxal phosphate-dependent enzyme [Deltaproteobacteria bacterium]MBT4638208.1 TrpB-like pyridoxal phosphate-dependent enzyme [Deltaproteobacteria bacterium]MBT6501380.1 TrpB-like pyridoxal phosphate-dependent enzyme [Deltaproteobacteria bacterium]MBT7155064.1 TrpB-like pyridoxal phosphate-dependent enzyme [Deltaproteobacteria bacterium]
MTPKKIFLTEDEMPRQWYNILADIKMNPPLGPDGNPIGPEALAAILPMPLIEQEVSSERWIDIPEEVLAALNIWRPSPLVRATELEKALGTPAKIYFKNESLSPPGSHKPNTAIPQAYYNKIAGTKRITTETGAGQWGSALSFACNHFGLECLVYMVRVSFDQKPYRKSMMQAWNGNCIASPSTETQAGRDALARDPNTPGSLGIAISEAIEAAVSDPSGTTKYSLGSVLNHVMLHQTIIGLEAKKQFEKIDAYPDIVIGCAGGGSNFAGIAFPFVHDKINGKQVEIYPVEPAACPTLTKAPFVYDHGDTQKYTPLLPMHSLGHAFVPPPFHAGGLRYHGMAPTVSQLVSEGLINPKSVTQLQAYKAGVLLARTEGIIPAPETNHALACVIDEANKAKEEGKEKTILFNWSGHGLIDLMAYDRYFAGDLKDFELSDAEMVESEKIFESFPKPELLKST